MISSFRIPRIIPNVRSIDLGLLEHPSLIERNDGEVLLAPDREIAVADRRGDRHGQRERWSGDASPGRERRKGGIAFGGREDGRRS